MKKIQEKYEINEETLAILPIDEHFVRIYELEDSFDLCNSATQIMEDSCRYFGSSLEGRRKGTESLIGVNYKAPIIVEETQELIFFPMSSTRFHDTPWIGLKNLKTYYRSEEGIVIEFQNGQKLTLDSSYGIVNNQVLRATRLESALRGRKTRKKRLKI